MSPFAEAGEALDWLLNASLQAALLVPVILLAQWLLRHRLSARWRFALWWLLILRLLLPVSFASPWSIFNFVQPQVNLAGPQFSPPATADMETATLETVGDAAPIRLENNDSAPIAVSVPTDTPQAMRPVELSAATPLVALEPTEVVLPALWQSALDADDYLIPLIWAAWFLVAFGLMAAVMFQSIAFSRRLRAARQHAPAPLNDLLAECRQLVGIRCEVTLLETEAVTSPVLYGLFRHRILLPWGFADRFSPAELRHVLLHELAHVKRGDLWLNWLVTALQIVHWFNPLVWLGFARLRADRELACDELALLRSGADTGRDYGRTMLKLLRDFARPKAMPGLVGILEDKQQMQRRVWMIARFKRPSRWSALALIPIAALGLVLLTDAQVPAVKPVDEPVPTTTPTTAEATRMILRVLDEETGKPIPDAAVQANYFFVGGQMEPHELMSDVEGVARIPIAERTETVQGMNVFITPEHFVPVVVSWSRRDTPPHEYTVRMKPALTVGGRVVDEAGQPVSGVHVSISSPDVSGQTGRERVAFNSKHTAAYSDADGRWLWPHLPRTMTNFWFALTATNYMATDAYCEVIDDLSKKNGIHGIHGIQTFHLTNASGLTTLETVIYHGFSLTGRVIDQEQQPVAGALVREVHNRNYRYRVQSVTDDRGEFVMRGLKHQPTTLVSEARGFSPASAEIELHVGPNKHTFLLNKGRAFKGIVVDPNGTPIINALIRTDTSSQGIRLFNWTARSDAEGRFEWPHAPYGEVLYWFEADGFLPVRDRPLTADDTEHQIILEPRDPPPSASVPQPIFELRLVESEASDDAETLSVLTQAGKEAPANLQKLFVRKEPLLDATAIASAKFEMDEFIGRPVINIEFTAEGQVRFAEVTRQHVGRQLAFFIDGQVVSAPVIAQTITGGRAPISGSFTRDEAERLTRLINDHIARKSAGITPVAGTIEGRVILEGKPPPEREIAVIDAHSRAQHTSTPTTQFYVVADDGGLRDVVVYLEGDLPPLASAADLPPLVIDHQRGFKVPYISALAVGQTLLLTNSDVQLHNCHITPPQGSGNREVNKALMRGVASPHKFTAPAHWVRLKCDVHPWEFAYLCVFPHRYFAVTDASGHYNITNVPPGRYKLHALHRRALGDGPIDIEVVTQTLKVVPISLRPDATNATAQTPPVESRPAATTSSSQAPARFVEITTEIEFENWAGPLARDESSIPRERQRTRSVIGTNSWMIESDWNGRVTRWFTGTRIIARGDAITGYEVEDTNPSGPVGVDALMGFDLPAAVTWQAFGSGPAHRREGAKLYPPSPLWEQARLAPAAWSERTEIFRDGLGLPKSINLVTADGESIYWYQVLAWTNVMGWNVPTEFQGVAYRRRPASGSEAHLTFEGKVVGIGTSTELNVPEQGGQPNAPVASMQPSSATNMFEFGLVTPAQALDAYRQLTGRELIVSTQVTNVAAFVGAKSARGSREELAKKIKDLLLEQAGLVITELDGNRASVTHNEALSVKPLADPAGRQPPPLGPNGKDVIKPDSRPRVPPPGRPNETTTSRSTAASAPFMEIEVEIEIEDRGGSFGRDEINISRRSFVQRCIVVTNSWMIESATKYVTSTYWFSGTNFVKHSEKTPAALAHQPGAVRVAAWRFDSSDGNPGRPRGEADLIMADLPARLVWQAFCSGPVLRSKDAKLFPPSEFWKQLIPTDDWSTRTDVFSDGLGLPKSIDLVLNDGQPIFEYRVSRTTQFKGWNFPEEFHGVSYRAHRTSGWEAELRFTGRITAISPASEPVVPAKVIQAIDASAGVRRSPAAPGEPAYPYTLETSPRAFTRVSRENDAERVKIEFLKWAGPGRNGQDALFRVTNPGSREVLIWNVRQQVLATNATGGFEWKNLKSDYPGGGWEKATIPDGGSTVFPMSPVPDGDWRVCLLYSRLKPKLVAEEDAFRGDLESIGPVIAGTAVD